MEDLPLPDVKRCREIASCSFFAGLPVRNRTLKQFATTNSGRMVMGLSQRQLLAI
jgi:hypothetical protein